MKLSDTEKGRSYRIKCIVLPNDEMHRLLALGLTENTVIFIVGGKRNGPRIIKIRGTRLAIGRKFCQGIEVGEVML